MADCCSEIRGTSSYLAPEVLTSNDDPFDVIHKYNEKCDLWSTGIIIYELLTCINPFIQYSVGKLISEYEKKGEQFISSHFKLDFLPAALWNHVSPEAIDLIRHLLVIDPKDRWSARECLQADWFKDFNYTIPPECESLDEDTQCELLDSYDDDDAEL